MAEGEDGAATGPLLLQSFIYPLHHVPTILLKTSGSLFRPSVPAQEPTPASIALWHK
ncbi:hypothetical protein [Paenibacillus sp. FSL K6-2393]|uniref:hypothetical protein n=1 Tax=Paenibacillus sp. FSL K6-2393 TaxID=2921475 RepID=UPI0030F6983A